MLQDIKDLTTPGVVKGLNTQYNLLTVQKDQSPNMMDVKINYDGSIEKRLGTNKMNLLTITGGSTSTEGFNPTTANILTSFVSYWNLNELSGDRRDIVSGYTMSQSGGVSYADGMFGKASLFEASCSQFLRAASSNAFTGNPAFSYAAWFYLNSTGGTVKRTILAKRGTVAITEGGGIVPDSYDVLVANCDNTGTPTQFLDSSTTSTKIITANGNATQLPIKFNKSAGFFNGTTDYVVVPDSADWDLGTTDYDVTFYFNMSTVQTCYLLDVNAKAFSVYYAAGHLYVYQATAARIDYTFTPTANTWYKIKVARVSGTTTLYKDDVSVGTPYAGSDNISGGTTGFFIGAYSTPASYFSGWLKNLSITKVSTLVLDMRFDTPATSPLGPAIAFDGTGDYLDFSNDAGFAPAVGAFDHTFYYNTSAPATDQIIIDTRTATANITGFYIGVATSKLVFGTATTARITGGTTLIANAWYKVRVVGNGGANGARTAIMYLNNIQEGSTYTNDYNFTDQTLRIGSIKASAGTSTLGYLREILLTKAGATVLNIHGNENNGTAGTSILDTTAKTVTCVGDAKIKYTEDYRSCVFTDETGKFPYPVGSAKVDFFANGSGVGYFDGTNSFLDSDDSADWYFDGAFAEELYVRFTSKGAVNAYNGLIGQVQDGSKSIAFSHYNGAINTLGLIVNGTDISGSVTWTPLLNTWYHIAVSRNGNNFYFWENGTQIGSTYVKATAMPNLTGKLQIGKDANYASFFSGLLDNIRISKGIARYTAAFNPPAGSSGTTATPVFEYSLHVDSNNLVTFDVSSSGTVAEGTVRATSFGALTTATWYNAICWYDSANERIGVVVNESYPVISAYTAGLISGSGLLQFGAENTANFMDGRIDEVGFWAKALDSDARAVLYNKGVGNTYGSSVDVTPWASFDFGASSIRWLSCAAGTGLYASSNLGNTWVNIGTTRTANYQYFDRSKNVLVATSDSYDPPLYWSGSAGTYALSFANSAPWAKYSINFSGYLIMLNSKEGSSFGGTGGKRTFHYLDANFQLSSTAWLNFDMPSSADDEITAVFVLRRYLYVSTKYKIFRVSYVGGSPDWQVVEVKSWGFIPRTVKKIVISNQPQAGQTSAYSIGEVVIGLTWDRKLRIFDGSGDQILSNNVEKDNGMCEFALDKISYFGSGPILSFAEVDPIPNVYRLCVSIGLESSNTTHFLNYDARCQALYPYANMPFNTMCIAESANRQYLMAFDRSGYCHMIDSGNLDANTTPINEYFESPMMFGKTPSQVSKGHKTDMFFSNTTSGTLYYEDRTDFSNEFNLRKKFAIGGTSHKIVHFETVDVPETYNTYQFRLSSSGGTSAPWRLQRYDHFTKGLGIGRND